MAVREREASNEQLIRIFSLKKINFRKKIFISVRIFLLALAGWLTELIYRNLILEESTPRSEERIARLLVFREIK